MNKKITIPIITFEVENPIEYIRYAYYLKKVLMNEGYNIYIITKERTEGGLNKRASSCALLFSTLLVFPN